MGYFERWEATRLGGVSQPDRRPGGGSGNAGDHRMRSIFRVSVVLEVMIL